MRMEAAELLAILFFVAAVTVIVFVTVQLGARIEVPNIPMQWGADGKPTWYAPRTIGLWWILYLTVVVGVGLLVLAHFSSNEKAKSIWLASTLFSIATSASQWWHLNAVLRWAARQ